MNNFDKAEEGDSGRAVSYRPSIKGGLKQGVLN